MGIKERPTSEADYTLAYYYGKRHQYVCNNIIGREVKSNNEA